MFIPKGHLKGFFISLGLVGATVSAGVLASTNLGLYLKRNQNEGYNRVLDNKNQPTLNAGEGTMTDNVGVIWEYHNATSYNNGHVSLSHDGYFGIKSNTPYGIPGITTVTATFTAGTGGELWLLKSLDGVNWGEVGILASGTANEDVGNWRFVRFYYYADNSGNTGSVNIDEVVINYTCANHDTLSAQEAVDGAKASNVVAVSAGLTYAAEYNDLSPNSDGGEAVAFTKTGSSGTNLTIGFGETYTIGKIKNAKVEFDMKTSNINYGKTIQLMKDSSTFGGSMDSSKSTVYKCTNIQDDWYHIEVAVTAFISTISGYGSQDLPVSKVETKEVNGIKINAGTCVIDNLRISYSQCALGNFNNPTWVPKSGDIFWLKTTWVGKLYPEQVTMTFSDDTLVRRVPLSDPNLKNGSPFYLELLAAGTVTVTCTVISGYNRTSQTIQHTITIK